jgi:hypothetical protein
VALKKRFNEDERFGLTQEELNLGEKFLRKNKTAGIIPEPESFKLYEMFMIGCSFNDISQQYPQYPIERIIMTAALKGWTRDRDKMMGSLRERVQAKVVKSVIEQVDFLTTMLSVTNAEHLDQMRKYILDPNGNPKPDMRIMSIKEYKEIIESLYKIVAGSTPGSKTKESPLFNALSPAKAANSLPPVEEEDELDPANLIEAEVK